MKDYSKNHKRAWESMNFGHVHRGTKYTISEIINSIINSGFSLKKFDEHPEWTNNKIPGEFTAIAIK